MASIPELFEMGQFFLTVTGFASGFLVAGGVVALMIGLGILTRFIGITRTAHHILWYENAILSGTICGTILTVYSVSIPVGSWLLAIWGLFTGIFVGGWILALAEVVQIFPVYSRRLGITKGRSFLIIALAAGKTAGCLLQFSGR